MIECRRRGRGRGCWVRSAWLIGASLLAGCSDLKQMVGLDPTMPDEFAVESRAPLTIPPDFDLRPPEPGAPRPQEKTAEQQAQQAIEQAGPGTPGNQEFRFAAAQRRKRAARDRHRRASARCRRHGRVAEPVEQIARLRQHRGCRRHRRQARHDPAQGRLLTPTARGDAPAQADRCRERPTAVTRLSEVKPGANARGSSGLQPLAH